MPSETRRFDYVVLGSGIAGLTFALDLWSGQKTGFYLDQREARAASRLNHPNSIAVLDFGEAEDGTLFMAMEFLQGQDLFASLKKEGPLPADRVARIMIQVCSALAEAHEQNVIHRDLKPENIMVEDRRGQRDFVKVQGAVLVIAVIYVVVNLLVDLTLRVLDPRVRAASARGVS